MHDSNNIRNEEDLEIHRYNVFRNTLLEGKFRLLFKRGINYFFKKVCIMNQ